MIIVDNNILLYLVDSNAIQHADVVSWWEDFSTTGEAIGVPWNAILGFLRIATHPRVLSPPLTINGAIRVCERWLAMPNVQIIQERPEHAKLLMQLLASTGAKRNLVMDAHLAALAISHDAALVTCDADFARFPGLRWLNPLES